MPRRPLKEAAIEAELNMSYPTMLTMRPDEVISWNDLCDFFSSHANVPSAGSYLKRLYDAMANETSQLRAFLRPRGIDAPLNLGMHLYELQGVLKEYEEHIQDPSHGWWSSTPLNIVLYYQVFTLTGKYAWKDSSTPSARVRNSGGGGRTRPSPSSSSTLHCVYMIKNEHELNAFGNPMVYIGRTRDLRKRLRQHVSVHSGCRLIRDALQRTPVHQMTVKPLVVGTAEDMRRCESDYIRLHDCVAPRGYNLRCGDTEGMSAMASQALVTNENIVVCLDLNSNLFLGTMQSVTADLVTIMSQRNEEDENEAPEEEMPRCIKHEEMFTLQ